VATEWRKWRVTGGGWRVPRILWAGLFWLCICSFVSLVLPAESATSTWSGFLLLVWLASGLGGGWRAADVDDDTHSSALWVQQLSKYTNRTPTHTHTHCGWVRKGLPHTHTHWHTDTHHMRNMANLTLTLALLPLLLIYANFWPACASVRVCLLDCGSFVIVDFRLALLLFKHLKQDATWAECRALNASHLHCKKELQIKAFIRQSKLKDIISCFLNL